MSNKIFLQPNKTFIKLQIIRINPNNVRRHVFNLHSMRSLFTSPSHSRKKKYETKTGKNCLRHNKILFFSILRYLEYFIGLLSGEIKINSLPLYLKFIKMESPPCMHHMVSKYESEWSSFIKIFEGERFVFISGKAEIIVSRFVFFFNPKLGFMR